jgi:serine protease Do
MLAQGKTQGRDGRASVRCFFARVSAPFVASVVLLFAPADATAAGMSRGFNRLLEAVVRIDVRELTFEAGARRYTASLGSGVIMSADGIVLTNAHVVSRRAVEINVTLANLERVGARLVGWDHWTDLAVLRLDMAEVKRRDFKLAHAQFGDSQKLFPGQEVFAVGTPHGLTRTVTRGIVSNNNRYFEDTRGIGGYETGMFNTWLQTDAAINPGNSGGPLVTGDGKVIGISSRGYLGANNLGFAIPAATARVVLERLVREGAVVRSYVGIVPGALQDLENFYSLALNTGMLVNSVDPGSPAARAGLRAGDIVLAIDGAKVDGRFPEQLPPIQNLIASRPIGATLRLTVKRSAETRDFTVVTEKLESRIGEEWALEKWGLSVRRVSRAYARENQLEDTNGVVVIGVQPGFPAEVAGLTRGDVITAINQQPITSLEVIKSAHAAYEARPVPTLLETQRSRRVSLYILKP